MSRLEKRAKESLLMRLMHIGKHEKASDENIFTLLTPSILGMMLCVVCLAGTSWAWFTSASTSEVAKIQAAEVRAANIIAVDAASQTDADTQNSGAYVVSENTDGTYTLRAGTLYTVILNMKGNAANGGYCIISGEGKTYYTPKLLTGEEFMCYICPRTDSVYTIESSWGELPYEVYILSEGELIGEEPTYAGDETSQEENSQQTEPQTPQQNNSISTSESNPENAGNEDGNGNDGENASGESDNDTEDSDDEKEPVGSEPSNTDNSDNSENAADNGGGDTSGDNLPKSQGAGNDPVLPAEAAGAEPEESGNGEETSE